MKSKSFARILVLVLLLVSGSTLVRADEPDPCSSVEPIRPGDAVTDAVSDVPAAHIDLTEVETSLSGERLTVVFHLRDLPETLKFNRTELGKGTKEYEWGVAIDVDNDRSTGPGGFDTLLTGYHIAFLSHKGTDADTIAPIGEMLEASVWTINPDGSTSTEVHSTEVHSAGSASTVEASRPAISAEADTITMVGVIPGITSESRLTFEAYDAGFPGGADWIECHDSFSKSMLAWPRPSSSRCETGEAVRPGQSINDDLSDALAAHVDVTEISTSLSGETLTVVFHFRDVPEALTFNRTGVPDNVTEYSWEVSIDVDGDQYTGLHGFEYLLTSIHVSNGGSSVRDRRAAIAADDLQTNTWVLNPGGSAYLGVDFLGWARIEVSAEEDTVTLVGEIPGITAESQLAFGVYDYLGGSEEVGCLTPFGLGRPASLQGSSDGSAVTPGQSVAEDVSHELAGHVDIIEVTTALAGETLTVVFHLRDVPETLTFDRTGVPDHVLEYMWGVSIDADNDGETGSDGFEYTLAAIYFVHPPARDGNTVAALAQPGFVEANVWGQSWEGDKVFRIFEEASLEVSADDNTITLVGEIPGITADSPLKFKTHDYFGGSEEIGRHASSIEGLLPAPCDSDEAAVTPGQRVLEGISETLPAHIDIIEVSTALNDGTLAVVFHLRDLPETLEFNREGVAESVLEYDWEVSIDVDDDRETGVLGFDYAMGASHFVYGSRVHKPIEEVVQANSWQLEESGGVYLSGVSIEVSSDENTITLRGEIPGISPQSRLVFEAYDFLEGSEQVACHAAVAPGDGE